MRRTFKTPKVRIFLFIWRLIWLIGMPAILIYLSWRGRDDPDYFRHLSERFGWHTSRSQPHIWIHAVSYGELRSAEPIIRSYLAEGQAIVTTHFTPAGRRASQQLFAAEIATGQLSAVWVPFDYGMAFRRFFRAFRPRFGLVMEIEMWPGMIAAADNQNVLLFLCNGQYPTKSYEKDEKKVFSRRDIVQGFAGVMVKNDVQAQRFLDLGQSNVAITGEMRFEQSLNPVQLAKASEYKSQFGSRPVTTFTSVVIGEDALFIEAIKETAQRAIYVPRAPERFDETFDLLRAAGLNVLRRSNLLDSDLVCHHRWPTDWDVLLGDSMGEMAFYLGLGDRAVIGGGFVPKGSHNIIEPLAMSKPVIVGPHIWTIEFPVHEAIAAGVAKTVTPEGLAQSISSPIGLFSTDDFLSQNGGSVAKTRAALTRFGVGAV